jgi:hypothetical protein
MEPHAIITAKYEFTDQEINSMGRDLGQKHAELDVANRELDRVKLQFKERIGGLENRIKTIAEKVVNGFELREFKCRVEYDRSAKEKIYRDIETEKEVARYPFTTEDMQAQFPL